MKLYKLNDYEHWAANSLEEAIEVAMRESGLPREEVIDMTGGEPHEVDPDALKVAGDDWDEPEPKMPQRTAAEIMEKMDGPGLVCCTADAC